MYISKSRQVFIITLSFWTRGRFSIQDYGFVLVFKIRVYIL